MSSTNPNTRGGDGVDDFPTPPWVIERLLERVSLPVGRILEPCAGEGLVIDTMRRREWCCGHFTAVEIQERHRASLHDCADVVEIADLREYLSHAERSSHLRFDLAITNPPFKHALEVLKRSRKVARWTVLLLRVGFLEGGASPDTEERAAFLDVDMPDVYVLPNRPPFAKSTKTGKWGTDSATYAWMVWTAEKRSVGKATRLAVTPKDVRSAWMRLQREKDQ